MEFLGQYTYYMDQIEEGPCGLTKVDVPAVSTVAIYGPSGTF